MELILVLAFAWAGVRAIGEMVANTAAAIRGAALPYPPAGSGRVRTRTAAGGTVSYATGRGGGALAGLAWESGKSGWAKGWSWGTTRVQEARIRRGADRTRQAAEQARRSVEALDTAAVDTAATDTAATDPAVDQQPGPAAGPADNAAPTLETRPAGQRRGPFDGDPSYEQLRRVRGGGYTGPINEDGDPESFEDWSRRHGLPAAGTTTGATVVHDSPTYLMGAELEAWKRRHPEEAAAAGYARPDRYGGTWLRPDATVAPEPEGFAGSPAERRLRDLRDGGYEGPVDVEGYVRHPADLTPAQQDLLDRHGYQHNPPAGADRPVDGADPVDGVEGANPVDAQSPALATWTRTANGGVMPEGDIGGDYQVGEAYGVRYGHSGRPGALTTVSYYAEELDADGQVGGDAVGPTQYGLTEQTELMRCADPGDPGGTELWAETTYRTLPGRFDTVEDAEGAARAHAEQHQPDGLSWDGRAPWERDDPPPAQNGNRAEPAAATDLSGPADTAETGVPGARHLSVVPAPSAPGGSSTYDPHPMSGDPGPGAVTTTEGNTTMTTATGETTNIEATRTYLAELAGHVQSDILSQLELATSTLQANNVDQATLRDLATIREQFDQAVNALGELAGAITDRHGAVEEAINSADEVAETDWYRHQ